MANQRGYQLGHVDFILFFDRLGHVDLIIERDGKSAGLPARTYICDHILLFLFFFFDEYTLSIFLDLFFCFLV